MIDIVPPTQNTILPGLIILKEVSEILEVHPNTLRQWDKKRNNEYRFSLYYK